MGDKFEKLSAEQMETVEKSFDFPLGTRLQEVLDVLGTDLAVESARRSAKQLRRYVNGDNAPTDVLQGLANAAEVSMDWLTSGEVRTPMDMHLERKLLGEAELSTRSVLRRTDIDSETRLLNEYALACLQGLQNVLDGQDSPATTTAEVSHRLTDMVEFEFFDLKASAGGGAVVLDERASSTVGVSKRLLDRLGVNWKDTIVLMSSGDSMYPTIPDGSVLLVEKGATRVATDKVYVLSVAGDLFVKRVRREIDGGLTLVSDNKAPQFSDQRISPADLPLLNIVGRVVYVLAPV